MPRYEALVLDLDGTLLQDSGKILPRTRDALRRISGQGIHVMIATGRSEQSAKPVIEDLGILNPTVIYNGAAIWCPREKRLIEERNLSAQHLGSLLRYAQEEELLPVVMCAGSKRALSPRSETLNYALHDMKNIEIVSESEMHIDRPIRLSLFSDRHHDTESFANQVRELSPDEAYLTWFPLNLLPSHRDSPLQVVDVQPKCEGKKEALRFLQEHKNIDADRCVAIGDAPNDLPMVESAGLGVAMGNAMDELKEKSDRIIGANSTTAIADLIDELWPEDTRADLNC
ncbi:MAG: HAD family hydrolase [Planctomycetota bacterium]|nr:HAD family hydrolase [Planctomycetota bacterium]